MSRIREEETARHRRKRGLHLGDFGCSQSGLLDAHFVAQSGAPLRVFRRHLFTIEIKASLVAKEVRHAGLFGKIAPGRHRLSQQARESEPVAARGGRQRLPNKAR